MIILDVVLDFCLTTIFQDIGLLAAGDCSFIDKMPRLFLCRSRIGRFPGSGCSMPISGDFRSAMRAAAEAGMSAFHCVWPLPAPISSMSKFPRPTVDYDARSMPEFRRRMRQVLALGSSIDVGRKMPLSPSVASSESPLMRVASSAMLHIAMVKIVYTSLMVSFCW